MKNIISRILLLGLMVIATFTLGHSTWGRGTASPRPDFSNRALDRLVEEALSSNPSLKAQRQKVLASQERPSQAGALPDPTADIQFMMLPVEGGFNAGDTLSKGVSLGMTQRLPYPGKRKLRRQEAERSVDAAKAHLKAMESNLRGEVIAASYRFALYLRLLDINEKTQDALVASARGAAGVYASGKGLQSDVLLAQAALTKSKADRKTLSRQLEITRAHLDDLLGGPADPQLLERITIPDPGSPPALDGLLRGIGDTAPAVLQAQAEVAVRERRVEIARKDFKPDFLVGGRYRHNDMTMDGRDYLTAMVGITLPFFHRKSRYSPALREASYLRESAKEQASNVLNEAKFMVTEAFQDAVRDRDVYILYRDGLLIQAKKAYESALASYTVGDADFMTMLRALTNYYAYSAQAYMAKAGFQVSLARIEGVLGRPLEQDKERSR